MFPLREPGRPDSRPVSLAEVLPDSTTLYADVLPVPSPYFELGRATSTFSFLSLVIFFSSEVGTLISKPGVDTEAGC